MRAIRTNQGTGSEHLQISRTELMPVARDSAFRRALNAACRSKVGRATTAALFLGALTISISGCAANGEPAQCQDYHGFSAQQVQDPGLAAQCGQYISGSSGNTGNTGSGTNTSHESTAQYWERAGLFVGVVVGGVVFVSAAGIVLSGGSEKYLEKRERERKQAEERMKRGEKPPESGWEPDHRPDLGI